MNNLDKLVSMYSRIKTLHTQTYEEILEMRDTATELCEAEYCADAAYVMKKSAELLVDLRKELDRVNGTIQRIGCMIKQRDMDQEPIHGSIATGTPKLTFVASIPNFKTHPEECRNLMKGLGIPDELVQDGAVRPDWPTMVQLMSDKIASGVPLPEGVDGSKTYPKYAINTRARSGVDLDALAAELESNDGEERGECSDKRAF